MRTGFVIKEGFVHVLDERALRLNSFYRIRICAVYSYCNLCLRCMYRSTYSDLRVLSFSCHVCIQQRSPKRDDVVIVVNVVSNNDVDIDSLSSHHDASYSDSNVTRDDTTDCARY